MLTWRSDHANLAEATQMLYLEINPQVIDHTPMRLSFKVINLLYKDA